MRFLDRGTQNPPRSPGEQRSDDEADYLLSGGRLSGPQRERIFAAVDQASHPQAGPSDARLRARIIGAAALAAIACFVFWPRAVIDHGAFRDKGGVTTTVLSDTTDVECEVTCLRATLAACPQGSILAFSARGASADMFVTTYLRPATGGARVWLIANEPASAKSAGMSGLLVHGARLPDALNAGTYTIDMVVSRRPLSRDEATNPPAAAFVARARFEATVPP